jgi:hypothetical protein
MKRLNERRVAFSDSARAGVRATDGTIADAQFNLLGGCVYSTIF